VSREAGTSPRIVLGVTGGIAAYKAAELLRRLTESGYDVEVVPTRAALEFVGRATWEALSGHPVRTEVFDDVVDVPHVRIGQAADLVLVAPATADLLAKAAHGLAGDLLTNTLLTATCPVVYAPAMHTEMWEHPATRANVAMLRSRGAIVIDPAVGRLTGADSGVGRLPEPEQIFELTRTVLVRGSLPPDLAGRKVVVSAGGTREPIDPVRFIGNRSSGRQGYAVARAAAARGAEVIVIAANVTLADPAGAKVIRVGTTAELRSAVLDAATTADVIVMAAAVADFRPAAYTDTKIKKSDDGVSAPVIQLARNPDILAELGQQRAHPGQVLVGFAAETGDASGSVLDYGRAKLARKHADLLVVNQVGPGQGFEAERNEAVILAADGSSTPVPLGPKDELAHILWDRVVVHLSDYPAGSRSGIDADR
jgi:phosphopantothenoylcysteine decarboxylase / phosphopantothenate---cysteine ligase